MCGIGGFVDWSESWSHAQIKDRLTTIMHSMNHRGPDAQNTFYSATDAVALAHTRLSIVDLTENGRQPMSNVELGTHLVFNGEIYNHEELREELVAQGIQFQGTSDTEVLLVWLSLFGIEGLAKVDGMFAFCFYDEKKKTLLLDRDPMGEKPLYFVHHPQRLFAFASETQTLLKANLSHGQISADGLSYLLRQGSIPPPFTHIDDIQFLRPGHLLRVDLKNKAVDEKVYWQNPFQVASSVSLLSDEEAAQLLEGEIKVAFQRRLRADVPVGAFLSGGIDSTYVCARLQEAGASDLNTFTVVMPNQPGDESVYAREISKRLGTTHHEIPIDLDADKDWLNQALEDMDVPSVDGPNTWLVSRAVAQQGFKVACSGVGGDELFYGYPSFSLAAKSNWTSSGLAKRMAPLGKTIAPVLKKVASHPKGLRVLDAVEAGVDVASMWMAKRMIFSEKEIQECINDAIHHKVKAQNPFERARELACDEDVHPLRQVSALEQQIYMHDQLLRDTDAMSMAHSLEVRLPLIGKHIVEAVARVSPEWLWRHGPKWVLKDWLSRKGFEGFFDRPKQGFTLNWPKILSAYFNDNTIQWHEEYFDTSFVEAEKKRFLTGERPYGRTFCFLAAHKKFAEASA
ncbi:MAG: asparagine synthase (glutamine-hydrolyzing) [Myxococcales bacterium]|nr:asparagine synthase (glutamine-hydrolyzing) [Myxococcales bacterium]